MITLNLPQEISATITAALKQAGRREVGGVLMAEHTGPNAFEVRELTVHKIGAFATFVRQIEEALGRLRSFFDRFQHDYSKFNYVGEWHSHPSFVPEPSTRDDESMKRIIQDPQVGANFVVLMIVKLDAENQLVGTVHTYLPDGTRHRSTIRMI